MSQATTHKDYPFFKKVFSLISNNVNLLELSSLLSTSAETAYINVKETLVLEKFSFDKLSITYNCNYSNAAITINYSIENTMLTLINGYITFDELTSLYFNNVSDHMYLSKVDMKIKRYYSPMLYKVKDYLTDMCRKHVCVEDNPWLGAEFVYLTHVLLMEVAEVKPYYTELKNVFSSIRKGAIDNNNKRVHKQRKVKRR